MPEVIQPQPARAPATQPFTFGGVARYASAKIGRVFLAALVFALLGAAAVARIASNCWFPVITEAAGVLPAAAGIRDGRLSWPFKEGQLLAANQFLSIEVVPGSTSDESAPADLALELSPGEVNLRSLYGFAALPYPRGFTLDLSRRTVVPAWGAWKAPAVAWIVAGSAILLILSWCVLAIPYLLVPLCFGGLAGREINAWRAWKLAVAAQWPGSLLMSFALALYSTGQTTLVYLSVMFAAHFVPTLFYLVISPFFLPRRNAVDPEKPKRKSNGGSNPFQPARKPSGKNPFSGS